MINYKGALGGLFKAFGGGSETVYSCTASYRPQEFNINVTINKRDEDEYEEKLFEPITFE